jgi:hypothetical protein
LLQAATLHVLLVQILLPRLLLQTASLHVLLVQILLPRLLLQAVPVHLLPEAVLRRVRPRAPLGMWLQLTAARVARDPTR